jgi:FkbM family methyltransferase
MSFSIKFGNFLFKNAFSLYKPLYSAFKNNQDAFEIKLLKQYIQKNDVVLDIGANIGFYASLISKLVGEKGQVHCFEPDVINYQHLAKSTLESKTIFVVNKAIGAKTETLKFYTSKNLNVDHRSYEPEDYDEILEIEATSVDDYTIHNKIMKVNFIKIDIQGYEMQALQGMIKTLEVNSDIKLISEFWPYGLSRAGSSVMAYFNFLTELKFNCYLLKKNNLQKLDLDKVKSISHLGEEHYFNIFATRSNV